MSWGTKRPDWLIEYKDKFGNRYYIEIRFWENNAKEIAFTDYMDLEWGHTLTEDKWQEFIKILEDVGNGNLTEGSFLYDFDGDNHCLEYKLVSRKDEYNAFRSNILRFRSICTYVSTLEGSIGKTFDCDISFDIPLKVVAGDLIKALKSDQPQTPNFKVEVRQ